MMEGVTSEATGRTGPPDEVMVRRAASGDVRAFGILVERHRGAVLRAAARLVGADDAEDVAQDAFLRAFHRLPSLRRADAFRPWLLGIVRNAALDTLQRRRRFEAGDQPEDAPEPAHERTPARLLEEEERRARLGRKLQGLKVEHRLVLTLRDIEGWTYDEIAVATGMPIGTVKGRLHRARAELIDVLRWNTYDWELPDGP
jgi:RNA polymerase sigma-70 factor (ECF subfamily)